MKQLVIIRHGESIWNLDSRFSGWADIPLTDTGISQAGIAGRALKKRGFVFDKAYTSMLKRAIKTLDGILDEMDLLWIPVEKTWRLNERNDGALQGLNRQEINTLYGAENFNNWVAAFRVRPPQISPDDMWRHPYNDVRYDGVDRKYLSSGEAFEETYLRISSFWNDILKKEVASGNRLIVSAHNHVMRCFTILFGNGVPDDYGSIIIPNAVPLIYEFDDDMNPINHYYLEL